MNIKHLAPILFLIILASCGRKKNAFTPELPEKSKEELVNRLHELSNLEWDMLSTKTSVKFSTEDQSNSFKASIKMKRDSAMLVNISFAGIPIVQSAISNDSLKLVNRRDKCYKFQDRSALENVIDFPIEYAQLQDIIIGKPLLFNKEEEHIQVANKTFYELKTKRKRNQNSNEEVIITYYLSPTTLDLNKVTVESPSDQTTMEIVYVGKHEKIEGLMLPQEMNLVIKAKGKKTSLDVSINKPDVSGETKLTLNVPDNYVACP